MVIRRLDDHSECHRGGPRVKDQIGGEVFRDRGHRPDSAREANRSWSSHYTRRDAISLRMKQCRIAWLGGTLIHREMVPFRWLICGFVQKVLQLR